MLPSRTPTPEALRIPERDLPHGTKSMAESKKHQEIEERHAISHLNRALIASNLLLTLILLMRFIFATMCYTDFRTGIGNADIRIIFGAGEDDTRGGNTLENWVMHSGSGGRNLATKNTAPEAETAKVLLTSVQPPLPPADTVKGYNPWLDKPRPTNIYDYLRTFEVTFIIDDSSSMEGARWSETRDALATIAEKTFELNVDTVSLRFLNNARHVRGFQASGKETLRSLFNTMRPTGLTPLGRALKAVFDEHLNRIDSAVGKGQEEYSKIPPLDIVVLTDGVPTDKGEDEPAKVIANAVKRLNDIHYHPNTINVQIVQIANERDATKAFESLVLGDNRMIVDTVPYKGVLDSDRLLRILLGGLHPNTRSQLPVATPANN